MKNYLLLTFFFVISAKIVFAQPYEGYSKRHLKSWISTLAGKNDKTSTKAETDSSYTYLFRGKVKPMDSYFLFDKREECIFEKWSFDCDTCYNSLIKYVLSKSRFKWKQTGPNDYLSKTSKQLKLHTEPSKFTLTITQLFMREQDYQVLYDKASDKSSK